MSRSHYHRILVTLLLVMMLPIFLFEEAHAEKLVDVADELVVAVPARHPPYYLTDVNNQPGGFAIDVFDQVAARAGIQFRYEIKPDWSEVCAALGTGSADIIPLLGEGLVNKENALITSAIETFPVSIFIRNSNRGINSVKDLNKHIIALVPNDCRSHLPFGAENYTLKKFDQFDTAFQSLISGQVDAMVYSETVMNRIASDYDLSDKIRALSPSLLEVKQVIAVRKSAPEIKDRLEISLQAFITSEEYKDIYRKWFVHQKPFWNVGKVFWAMAGLMVFVVGFILLLRHRELLALNDSLQQQITLATLKLSESNDYLRDLTVTDTLTGISNRRAFENSLHELMSKGRRYESKFSMLIFDIDDFKNLNDQYGHAMGDRVLTELVDRVKEIVRDVDVLSRWGGEEFTILMAQTGKNGAIKMAERCRQIVADTLFDEVGPVTISLGVTCFQRNDNERKFFKRADDALYQAKAEGKNRVVWIGDNCKADNLQQN